MASRACQSMFLLGVALLTLVRAAAGSTVPVQTVFDADEIGSTYKEMHSRNCIPPDFDWSAFSEAMKPCYKIVMKGTVPNECADTTALAQFYNCFAISAGQLVEKNGIISFDITSFENMFTVKSGNDAWDRAQGERNVFCRQMSSGSLKPKQMAVYSYMCARFYEFAYCDYKRSVASFELDKMSLTQRINFLEGTCPTSPISLLAASGEVTGLLFGQCRSDGPAKGKGIRQRYEASVSRIVCILQQFIMDDGSLNVPGLVNSISMYSGGDGFDSLLQLEENCGPAALGKTSVTAEEFVQCWAGVGLVTCAAYDANLVAQAMPESCQILLP